jgi:hypothetical protein
MKIKINETLKGIDGVEILKGDKGHALTLKDICVNSVLTPIQEDDDRKKFEKYEIFKKVRDAKDFVELTVEEIALTKKAIGKIQPPLIMGQCYEMLENNETLKIKR